MMDHSVPWIGLAMQRDTLDGLPDFALPPEYDWRYFQPGDEREWARVEISAGEFKDERSALTGFRKYYPTDEHLDERMFFLTDAGVPFATATAWFCDDGPDSPQGRLHWVGVDAAHQRKGLSYPLVALAMAQMRLTNRREVQQ